MRVSAKPITMYVDDLKFIGGLRFTSDRKHFTMIPSELATPGYGYPTLGVLDQSLEQVHRPICRELDTQTSFTDQTLVYGSYARGYKAGVQIRRRPSCSAV